MNIKGVCVNRDDSKSSLNATSRLPQRTSLASKLRTSSSNQSYSIETETKQNIIKTLENKFLGNSLPPKTPGLKKHNFVYSGNKTKEKQEDEFEQMKGRTINISQEQISFNLEGEDPPTPKPEQKDIDQASLPKLDKGDVTLRDTERNSNR